MMRILYAGSLADGGTCKQRMSALMRLGHSVIGVDTVPAWTRRFPWRHISALARRVGTSVDCARADGRLLTLARTSSFDILWIDKGLTISARALRRFAEVQPACMIVGYSPDDMLNPGNQSRAFWQHLPQYDVFFTTKSYAVLELLDRGARRVEFVDNAYDERAHRPIHLTSAESVNLGGPVGFMGSWEPDRARSLTRLAATGARVRVWGEGWPRSLASDCLRLENRGLWGDDYAKGIAAFAINLCFLRKANRDLQTTRSIEIPACGGFMLAERTKEHQALFDEGKEAEFFSDDEELANKVKFYLANIELRTRIAAAGRERCICSGYGNTARLSRMLEVVAEESQRKRRVCLVP